MFLWQRTLFKDSCYSAIYYINKFNIILASSFFFANVLKGLQIWQMTANIEHPPWFSVFCCQKDIVLNKPMHSTCCNSTEITRKYRFQKLDLFFSSFLKRFVKGQIKELMISWCHLLAIRWSNDSPTLCHDTVRLHKSNSFPNQPQKIIAEFFFIGNSST